MARVKRGVTARARHKKVLDMAKGARGRSSKCFRTAIQRVEKSLQYAYRDRRVRKRDFRSLWIQRINAGTRMCGITYGEFIHGLKNLPEFHQEAVDRKILADMAVNCFEVFSGLVERVKKSLPQFRQVYI
jgi:large subunit ribosomal protein L20